MTINVNEEAINQATSRNIINLMEEVQTETGYGCILAISKLDKKKNYVFAIVAPGASFEQRKVLGDWPNAKIKDYMLKMIAGKRAEVSAYTPAPRHTNMDREKFKEIVSSCSAMILGRLLNALHTELRTAWSEGRGYSSVNGETYNIIRKYTQVYNTYGKFRNARVISNVRTTLLTQYPIMLTAMIKAAKSGKNLFPPKYGVKIG
jgi:hypothetical protein